MKGTMPETITIPPEAQQTTLHLSPEAAEAVDRFIKETDWDAFWNGVTERTAPQIDAYEKARVKSLEAAPQHVFM